MDVIESSPCQWTTNDVVDWLGKIDLRQYSEIFSENDIDGETLRGLSELMVSELIPVIKLRVKFLKELKELRTPSVLEQKDERSELSCSPAPTVGKTEDLVGYKLPMMPPAVEVHLKGKDKQYFLPGRLAKANFVEVIFNSVVALGVWFPSRKGYQNIMGAVWKKYGDWLPGTMRDWQNSVIGKFKRERSPLVNEASIKLMKDKFGRPGTSGRKKKLPEIEEKRILKKQRSVADDDLEVGEGETEITIRKHIEWLKKELMKKEKDFDGIYHRMTITNKYRSEFLARPGKITEGLEEFPILRNRNYLRGEVFLCYNIKLAGTMDRILSSLDDIVTRSSTRCKSFTKYTAEMDRAIGDTTEEVIIKDLKLLYAFQLLPSILGESEEFIIVQHTKDIRGPTPVVVGCHKEGFNLHVEGEKLLNRDVTKFRQAIECWFASFWVFSLQYPAKLSKTLGIIEYGIIQCTTTAPSSIRSWVERLGLGRNR